MSMQHMLHGFIGEYLRPVLKESKFKETGVLTPEEFVAAGDFLVYKCPTWRWEAGQESKRKSYLPPQKQYLVTTHVPCLKRVKQMEYSAQDEMDDDWSVTHAKEGNQGVMEAEPGSSSSPPNGEGIADADMDGPAIGDGGGDDEEIPDMDAFDDENNIVEEDPAALSNPVAEDEPSDNILRTRTYDLSITYDKYYQVPRIWLFGYDEHRRPLKPKQVFEDISQDHANKTVTIEPHPNESHSLASIHPCRHASVMKKMLERSGNSVRVDQYLIVFLKFMSAVLPTIDYDYTISLE